MGKINFIRITTKAEGHGIVQTDGNQQKNILAKTDMFDGFGADRNNFLKNNNFSSISKKNYTRGDSKIITKDGEEIEMETFNYKIKITPDCIKHYMFDDVQSMNSEIYCVGNNNISAMILAQPSNILRGHTITKPGENGYSREGADSLLGFEESEVSKAKPIIETFSNGNGVVRNNANSFFYKESVGDISYEMKYGCIDLEKLQFYSFDEYVKPNYEKEIVPYFLEELKKNYKNSDFKYGKYVKQSSVLQKYQCFDGILLDDECIMTIVKDCLKRLLKLEIRKKNGFFKVTSLSIQLCDGIGTNNEWLSISSEEDIDNLSFETEKYYRLLSDEEYNNGEYRVYNGEVEKLTKKTRETQDKAKEQKKTSKTK